MKSSASKAIKNESQKVTNQLVISVFYWLLVCTLVMGIVQMVIGIVDFNQCPEIKAASPSGSVWDVDSLTCPNPNVKQIRSDRTIPTIPN